MEGKKDGSDDLPTWQPHHAVTCVREREIERRQRERGNCSVRIFWCCIIILRGSLLLSAVSFSSSVSLSLVSSALLSSRLMEQSMQIARVNRAGDRRQERKGWRRDNTSVQSVSAAPPISRLLLISPLKQSSDTPKDVHRQNESLITATLSWIH